MAYVRKAGWFVVLAVAMAGWMGVLGTLRGVAEASVIGSRPAGRNGQRGRPGDACSRSSRTRSSPRSSSTTACRPEEAMAKVRAMTPQELHRLASLTDRSAEGTDGLGFLIGVAILVLIIVVIIKLMDKEIIIR